MPEIGRAWLTAAALLVASVPAAADPMGELVAGRTAASPELAGLAVAVSDVQGLRWQAAWGRATIAASGSGDTPMRADTLVRVASVSKLVTAVAVLRLVEAGTLDLDTDVSGWLGWRLRNPTFPDAPVTLRQLMSHTAGIEDGPGYRLPLGATLKGELQDNAAVHWAAAAPGTRFSYANLNYGIVATVMEAATGERFDRLMTRLVFAPLRLDAGFNWSGVSAAGRAGAATLYRTGRDETDWHPGGAWVAQVDAADARQPPCTACDLEAYPPGQNGTLFSPQGGLRISVLGLARIGRMLLGQGTVDGVRLLTPASVAALFTPVWRIGTAGAGPGAAANGDTYDGLMRAYGPGAQCLSGEAGAADQPVAGAALAWCGHLGEAYGLLSGLWIDRAAGRVYVYALTGSRDDPKLYPHRSGFTGSEEAILTELVRH